MERRPSVQQHALQVREIWLSSEDTGAYGLDLGSNITQLLQSLVTSLPQDGSVMLRLGMTNPPYILHHLDAIAKASRPMLRYQSWPKLSRSVSVRDIACRPE